MINRIEECSPGRAIYCFLIDIVNRNIDFQLIIEEREIFSQSQIVSMEFIRFNDTVRSRISIRKIGMYRFITTA